MLADLLARFCWARAREHSFDGNDTDEFFKLLTTDLSLRQKLLVAIITVADPQDTNWPYEMNRAFLRREDLDWALDRLAEAVGGDREALWARVVNWVFSLEALSLHWGEFQSLIARSPELQRGLGWTAEHPTREDAIAAVSAATAERERQFAACRPQRPPPAPPEKMIARDLKKIAEGEPRWWVALCNDLFLEEQGQREMGNDWHDVTSSVNAR